jgi:hypothetical protein
MVRSRGGVSNLANTAISIVLAGNTPATSRLYKRRQMMKAFQCILVALIRGHTIIDGSMVEGGASTSVDNHGHGELRNRWSSASS